MKIINYAIRSELTKFYDYNVAVELSHLRWLTKPINWLLRYVGAYRLSATETYKRIQIDTQKADILLDRLYKEKICRGRTCKTFVIGYDLYHDFVTGYDFMTTMDITCNTPKFRGVHLVLDPTITGAIALEF